MTTVQEIERAVRDLSPQELAEFRNWFGRFDASIWDKAFERDVEEGRLDALFDRLAGENEGQPQVPLNEFLDNEKLS